ncbi:MULTISPECIES: MATE family efflux transporter [Photorhabdus]|uniref:Membrane protein involved in the export of O-antigen and teichoic acid n=1 Tax=Photorhabdus luminescens TaxID=29488 RepID=A0A1G5R692_PHOLU|nr:hypothetical protein [Photorhabdus luminescens]SCZ69330.1 Membrane protein involved in the export of O-antigen and teichoic acid [Photorhabdus luminescens]
MLKKISSSIILQSIGTLSSFLVIWIINRYYGLSAQGQFALVKSWIDLMVVIGCFGFPQSFIYIINQLNFPPKPLWKFSISYIGIVTILSSIIAYVWFSQNTIINNFNINSYIFLGMSVSFLVGHGLLRGLLLTKNDGAIFAIVSILPAICLLLGIIINLVESQHLMLVEIYLLAGGVSFLSLLVLTYTPDNTKEKKIPWKLVLKNGNNVFLQSLAITLLPMGTFWLMKLNNFSHDDIGAFNIAIYGYLMFALPLNMISPIFFNKWSKTKNIHISKKELFKFIKIGIFLIPISLIFAAIIPIILPIIFGYNIKIAVLSTQILVCAAFFLFSNNILSCFSAAHGYFRLNTKIYIFKALLCLVLILSMISLLPMNLTSIAICWLACDIITTIIFSYSLIKLLSKKV